MLRKLSKMLVYGKVAVRKRTAQTPNRARRECSRYLGWLIFRNVVIGDKSLLRTPFTFLGSSSFFISTTTPGWFRIPEHTEITKYSKLCWFLLVPIATHFFAFPKISPFCFSPLPFALSWPWFECPLSVIVTEDTFVLEFSWPIGYSIWSSIFSAG